ncbi:MAG: multiheme c-type cytochrome, partial [Verrucomicrobia bacterium]|nr:multiheme c-type cytochrome [Verrucomicrobiota bacterium]
MNSIKAQLIKQGLVLLLMLAFSLAVAFCANAQNTLAGQQALSGPVSFSFASSMAPVYDLTGSYQFDQQAQVKGVAPLNLSLGFSMQQDAAGRLRGAGITNLMIGASTNLVAARYVVNGTVTGGGIKAARAKFSIRWQVQDPGTGANVPTVISVQYNFEVIQGVLNGTARGQAKFAGTGNGKINTSVSAVPLPAGVDGSWGLTMNIQMPGGSGSIVLPNGRTLQANLTGNFSARSGLGHLKLSGTGGDKGSTLSLNYVTATSALENLSGKVLGQRVALKNLSGTVSGQASSQFAGFQACLECHTPIQQTLNKTLHTQVGVQCENCHGPAANHAANDYDPVSRPTIPYAGTSCGACHSGPKHPTYEEWRSSEHAEVVGDMNSPDRISSCGRCHSGSVRVSLVDGDPLPVGAANVPLGCPTCHQPHQLTGLPAQLRNPVFSTKDYYLTTTSIFTNNYDPSVNLCAQCHNHRGASWETS